MKKVSLHNVSARHKFKSPDTIEIVVMDHTDGTQATWLLNWKANSIERTDKSSTPKSTTEEEVKTKES